MPADDRRGMTKRLTRRAASELYARLAAAKPEPRTELDGHRGHPHQLSDGVLLHLGESGHDLEG